MRQRTIPAVKSLTDQQKYLLNRLPGTYEIAEPKAIEPSRIKAMRREVEKWDAEQRKISCEVKCDGKKLIEKAREAIYFSSIEQAIRLVREAESVRKCC